MNSSSPYIYKQNEIPIHTHINILFNKELPYTIPMVSVIRINLNTQKDSIWLLLILLDFHHYTCLKLHRSPGIHFHCEQHVTEKRTYCQWNTALDGVSLQNLIFLKAKGWTCVPLTLCSLHPFLHFSSLMEELLAYKAGCSVLDRQTKGTYSHRMTQGENWNVNVFKEAPGMEASAIAGMWLLGPDLWYFY